MPWAHAGRFAVKPVGGYNATMRHLLRCWTATIALGTAIVPAMATADPVANLAEAIRIPTVSHDQRSRIDTVALQRFVDFLQRVYPQVHARLQVERVGDYSLLLRWRGADASLAPVLFEAHYDVTPVEPGTEADWTHPPFAAVVSDGYLWGRGALDDKLSVIALFEAMEALLTRDYQPQRDLYVAIGHDEEIGGDQGAAAIAALLAERQLRFRYMIGEGGVILDQFAAAPDHTVALVALAQKSYLTLRLTALGQGGHSSLPPVDNALARIARAVSRLHDNRFEPDLRPPVSDMLNALAPHVGGLRGFLMRQQWLSSSILAWQLSLDETTRPMVTTTTAVTMMHAGVKENVVPQQASATVNFRLLPGDSPETVIANVTDIIDDPRVQVEVLRADPSPRVADPHGPGFAMIREALAAALPEAIVLPGLVVATTDTRHYQALVDDVYHFHPMRLPVSDAGRLHGTDERIAIENVTLAVRIYHELLSGAGMP